LLTDVVMPGRNGRELAEQVVRRRPSIRVLFMSGYSNDAVMMRGVHITDAQFIQKPFTIDELSTKSGTCSRRCDLSYRLSAIGFAG
jgi:two-component SAPR family response regulator